MPGKFSLYQDLTVEENLKFFATVFGSSIEKNYDIIKDIYVQIEPFKHRKAGKLSGGMKQKLALSCALIHRPSILFLDEPTTGVDAVSRKEFWEMLKGLKEQGITILVSTPYMDEAGLCDRIALIQKGKILSINTPKGVVNEYKKPLLGVKAASMLGMQQDLLQFQEVEDAYPFGEYYHAVMKKEDQQEQLKKYLEQQSYDELEVMEAKPDIEDCFIDLMKEIQ
jgi:ABC-2 type transport system ATP-binding protein